MKAVTRAYELIKGKLRSHVWPLGTQMPSIADLATQCGVSNSTMWKAIGMLRKESLVFSQRGSAIYAGPAGRNKISAKKLGHAWKQTQAKIGQDIFSGVLAGPELPPINKMAAHYGIAIDTMKKALLHLVQQGILVRNGRKFSLSSTSQVRGKHTVVLISEGNPDRGVTINDARTGALVNSFERECDHLGFRSRCEAFNSQNPSALLDFSRSMKSWDNPAGCIVNLWIFWNLVYWGRWLDLLRLLAKKNLPIIAIDQPGSLSLPADLLRCEKFRLLRIAGEKAGEQVAAYLLNQGHTRISYISPFINLDWAQNRYNGLCKYYSQYGGPEAKVELFAMEEVTDAMDLTLAILNPTPAGIRALFHERSTPTEIENTVQKLALIRKEQLPSRINPQPVAGTIQHMEASLVELAGKKHDEPAFETFLAALMHVASNSAVPAYLWPFFEKIYAASTGTAWVCSDDKTVISAFLFLKSKKKKIPEDIAVIGYNNWHDERELQISAFDFNMDGMVNRALVLMRDEKSLKNQPVISEVDGYIVERKTTRK